MADKVQRPRRVETFGGDCYAPKPTEAYMDQLETELRDTKALHAEICDLIFKTLCSIQGGKSFSGCLEEIKSRLEGNR